MTSPKEKVLLLSFNSSFMSPLRDFLCVKYQIETATSAQMAEFLIQEWEPKICLVEDTQEIIYWISKLRAQKGYSKTGVICFASGSQHNEERALSQGCDHWIHLTENNFDKIGWRIQTLLRRSSNYSTPSLKAVPSLVDETTLHVEELKIYPKEFLVKRLDQVVNISPTQFKLLSAFVTHPDQLLSRDWIKSNVWENSDISLRSIDAHISKLRKALPELDRYLMNIYGKGYIFSRSKQEAA